MSQPPDSDTDPQPPLLRPHDADGDVPPLAPMLDELKGRLSRHDASPLSRLRALSTGLRMWAAVAVAGSVAALVVLLNARVELGSYPPVRMALAITLLVITLVPLLRLALRSWHERATSAAGAAFALAGAIGAVIALALLPQAHVLLPHTAPGVGQALWQHALPCLFYGLGAGLPVFAATLALGRGVVHAPLLGALAGGVAGNLALQLHCPITEQAHLLAGHAMVVATAALPFLVWAALQRARRADVPGA